MAKFVMTTVDSAYTWSVTGVEGLVNYNLENNNQASDTQGFLRKTQKGKNRIRADVRIQATESAYNNTIAPMVVYPQDVNVTFERNIPLRNTNIGRFTFEDARFSRDNLQFPSSGSGNGELILKFVEVLDVP
jgi:hypothetical protein